VIVCGGWLWRADSVGVRGETAGVAEGVVNGGGSGREQDPGADAGADSDGAAAVGTVRDRFLAAGISQEDFEAYLGAGRVAVAGVRTRDPATPAPHPTAVAIMLELA
jgi:hypothetical protein